MYALLRVTVKPDSLDLLGPVLAKYKIAQESNRVLYVDFTSVVDYMWLLRAACECLEALNKRALLYLAAAVSDFYVPSDKMVIILLRWDLLICSLLMQTFTVGLIVANTQDTIRSWSSDDIATVGAEDAGTAS